MTGTPAYSHGQFCWIDYMAHEMSAAETFYTGMFDWSCSAMDTQGGPPYAMFSQNGKHVGGLGQMSPEMKSTGARPMWNSYINVDDIHSVMERAEKLGGTVAVPVMPVMDAGLLAFIVDPTGGTVGFWQKNQFAGSDLVNLPNSLCWNELATRDLEAAKSFFGELLGWEFELNPHGPSKYYIASASGRKNAGLMQMTEEWGDLPSHWMVYFAVADADAMAGKIKQLGGTPCVPPFDIPIGRIGVMTDPQGGVFSIIQLNEPTG